MRNFIMVEEDVKVGQIILEKGDRIRILPRPVKKEVKEEKEETVIIEITKDTQVNEEYTLEKGDKIQVISQKKVEEKKENEKN